MLAEKQQKLVEVEVQLVLLKSQYAERVEERQTLSRRVVETSTRIDRASKLMHGLSEEQVRSQSLSDLPSFKHLFVGAMGRSSA